MNAADARGVEWEFQIPAPGWVTGEEFRAFGPCWFFCGHRVGAVVWIGCLTTGGVDAPLYACAGCLHRLHAMAWDFTEAEWAAPQDAEGRPVPLYQPHPASEPAPAPPRGRVRRRRERRARTTFGTRLASPPTNPPPRERNAP
ncbi:hypothetical protein [Streptomyces sedi]|uniref:Uncharacterized protein n=1 Tax=Streptomyces sedi TaxID=555059 RepID=A0A5C4UQV4_9ACTN|nr:hypothetical protein [Streptomyces sedi]TNM26024.1 hypothetical protein FH715_24915 [Streptomyces sedi]